ncbi:MAG: radical SAM protein, partial [Terriglobales bacterium]
MAHAFQTEDSCLQPIAQRVLAGERLSAEDALALYRSPDILAIGWLANHERERRHGNLAYFNVNRHLNPTNVCVAACRLCAFGRKKDSPGSYTMALEEAWQTAASGYTEAVTEFHIVGGLHPDLPFQYFLDLIAGLKERFPQVHLKAFTMVEVAYLSKRAKLSIRETLEQLKAAGVQSLPGGGAEIFTDRVRRVICDHKIDGNEWLETARIAHQIGLRSNATMLYGHVENDEDRVDHLLKLRALQD